jgi:hypothetical protein
MEQGEVRIEVRSMDDREIEVAETLLGRCARPRPRLICVDGEVVDDERRTRWPTVSLTLPKQE